MLRKQLTIMGDQLISCAFLLSLLHMLSVCVLRTDTFHFESAWKDIYAEEHKRALDHFNHRMRQYEQRKAQQAAALAAQQAATGGAGGQPGAGLGSRLPSRF